MAFRSLFLSLLLCSLSVVDAVTVYSQLPLGALPTGTGSADAASYTGAAAYDPTMLQPPPIPQPPPATQFPIFLWPTADTAPGISIPAPSSFFGISIEMSVATQVSECPSPVLLRRFFPWYWGILHVCGRHDVAKG